MPPAGFSQSRALWEQASESTNGLLRAALYELQPLRYSEWAVYCDRAVSSGRSLMISAATLCRETLPSAARQALTFVRHMSANQWKRVAAAAAYYAFVRWMHAALDAGPVVLIVSALAAIFTVGLSDEGTDGLSAYSVFNKGFQKIMGSVDEDALLQQHVGGGVMGGMMMGMPQQEGVRDADDPPAAHLQRLRQQRPPPAAAAAARRVDLNDDDAPDDDHPMEHPAANVNRARRTGKKARRGNAIEQRRELRAQRDAAVALGFGGGDEAAAMFRLVEDQAAMADDDGLQ